MADGVETGAPYPLPRVTIKFCTQCKWMLRAAYYAQELLSTFSTSLGEVALQPSTGGTFVVEIFHTPFPATTTTTTTDPSLSLPPPPAAGEGPAVQARTLWDRKVDGGFPETKELKRRVRDVIEPGRDLGHVDRNHARPAAGAGAGGESGAGTETQQQQQQEEGEAQGHKDRPSRAELEAAGPAGAGYPGSSEAAAQLVGAAVQGGGGGGGGDGGKPPKGACESKEGCEDCD
ncbi:hypothetical protein N8I77_007355 [Diaporthe amygdali]|uniref:Uncharacterized protein n=1 Tax=Phomopsis amygdali TaxID=1214568 RepID=A0AAD9SD11_PHOAM|nr:hypothetical protein N8I77_007355 [Diaporthe amygdali]